jgi:hypothetical protein
VAAPFRKLRRKNMILDQGTIDRAKKRAGFRRMAS